MENDFKHKRVGSVPAVRGVVGFLAETVVGDVRAEVAENRVFGAVAEEVEVELWWDMADVDPSVGAVCFKIGVLGCGGSGGGGGGEEEEEEERGRSGRSHGGGRGLRWVVEDKEWS